MRGEAYNGNWSESWNTLNADSAAWESLRRELRTEFELLRGAIQKQDESVGRLFDLALFPHAWYHLGTIRQMVERVRAS